MENQVVEYTNTKQIQKVNENLLSAIKDFVEDLANVTDNKDFKDYCTIVNRIDISKAKAYFKLIDGLKAFFEHNKETMTKNNLNDLTDPNIAYNADNASFTFNFQQVYNSASEDEQEVIKDHLNHIWSILNSGKSPEEQYIDKIFNDITTKFSSDLTRDEQMMVAKDLFSDFQQQNLDISTVIKAACQRARQLLIERGADNQSNTLVLIDAVEEIDINNFNMIQFMGIVGRVGTLFSDGENNPLSDLLSNVLSTGTPPTRIPIDDKEYRADDKNNKN